MVRPRLTWRLGRNSRTAGVARDAGGVLRVSVNSSLASTILGSNQKKAPLVRSPVDGSCHCYNQDRPKIG